MLKIKLATVKLLAVFLLVFSPQIKSKAAVANNVNSSNHILEYEPKEVRLEGVLRAHKSYGAPNYDETSPLEKWYSLYLKSPINVLKKDNMYHPGENNVKEVQLILVFNNNYDFNRLLGRTLIIDGTLSHSITGHHHTDILLEPIRIYSLEKIDFTSQP